VQTLLVVYKFSYFHLVNCVEKTPSLPLLQIGELAGIAVGMTVTLNMFISG